MTLPERVISEERYRRLVEREARKLWRAETTPAAAIGRIIGVAWFGLRFTRPLYDIDLRAERDRVEKLVHDHVARDLALACLAIAERRIAARERRATRRTVR